MTFHNSEIEVFIEIHSQLQTNFNKRIRVRDLARQYNISITTLTKGFQFHYSKSIQQHRLECCMEQAKILIEKGYQIKAIKIELGYTTASSFARAFKKVHGCIPHRYKPQQ